MILSQPRAWRSLISNVKEIPRIKQDSRQRSPPYLHLSAFICNIYVTRTEQIQKVYNHSLAKVDLLNSKINFCLKNIQALLSRQIFLIL